ncbi:hypothetical protein HA402_012526 [Bradysia odoriphaga]|nr:hypothetical protein HA402_012526 [Bradysia odoriphaga]
MDDNNSPIQDSINSDRQRDRSRRGDKGTRFSDAIDSGNERDRSVNRGVSKRIYVSNIPYEYRWQDLKDLFRRVVGTVEFVELFVDESNKPRGCGIVEFKDAENVQKALEKMNRYELGGREIVVKEDHGEERDKYGRIGRKAGDGGDRGSIGRGGGGGGGGGGSGGRSSGNNNSGNRDRGRDRSNDNFMMSRGGGGGIGGGDNGGFNNYNDNYNDSSSYNTYGLSASFLNSLGIQGPLHTKVFVANLDYKVDAKKLKEVFKLAGRLHNVDLATDKDGNSRGFAVIEFDHPVEAVQAISMFDRQNLYERRMTVRLDRVPDKNEQMKLPEGLGGIGIGLGQNGEPMRNVATNFMLMQQNKQQQQQQQAQQQQQQNSCFGNNSNPAPVPVAPPMNNGSSSILGAVPNANLSSNLAAVVGTLGLGALSNNPLLTNAAASLNNLGLNIGGGNDQTSGGGGGGSNYNSQPPAFQSQSVFPSNYNTSSRGSDFDMQVSNTRSYNTQSQQDYNTNQGGQMGGQVGLGNQLGSSNLGHQLSGGMGVGNQMNVGGQMGSGNQMGGNQMGVNSIRGSDTIVVRNLPASCTWQTLRDKFRDVGEVKFAEIRGQDCGVVRFSKEREAEMAIKHMDGSRIDGRLIDVSFF